MTSYVFDTTNDRPRLVTAGVNLTIDEAVAGVITFKLPDTISLKLSDAGTVTAPNMLTLNHATSGTPAQGFGEAIQWLSETTTTEDVPQAVDVAWWFDVAHATRKGVRAIYVYSGATAQQAIYMEAGVGNATVKIVGGLNVGTATGAGAGEIYLANGASGGGFAAYDGSYRVMKFDALSYDWSISSTSALALDSGTFNIKVVSVVLTASNPIYHWYNTAGAVDEKYWRFIASGASLTFQTVNDAYSVANNIMALGRSGNTPSGVVIGAPTGSFKGAGTLNVAGDIYKNNVAYTNPDYVLEWWANRGIINRYADRPGAKDYRRMSLEEFENYIRLHYRLPGISDEPTGIFDMADIALEKIEELATYVIDLRHQIEDLEGRLA